MRKTFPALVTVCAILFIGYKASADDMRPLMELIVQGAEESYPVVRCAGLFGSTLEWAGETKMGSDYAKNTKAFIASMIDLATKIRTPNLGDKAQESVLRDVSAITDLYLARYQSNYTSSGQSWGNDPLWQSDTDVCVQLFGKH